MATPSLSHHRLAGALGDILVDVRTSQRGTAAPAVIVHHGFKGFKDYAFLPPFAERLARAGFTAVTLSVSGSGVDAAGDFTLLDRFAAGTYSRELDDLGTIVRSLQEGALGTAPPSSIGLVGHSRGGGMALCLARENPYVAAVVTWAAIARARRHGDDELTLWRQMGTIEVLHQRTRQYLPLNYEVVEDCLAHEHGRLDILAAASTIERPWLQVHGTADETVPIAEAIELRDAARGAHFESHFVDGAGHTFGTKHPWEGSSPHADIVFDRTTRFLSRHLS